MVASQGDLMIEFFQKKKSSETLNEPSKVKNKQLKALFN